MQQIILSSLIRQTKGTQLLSFLLNEEYGLLKNGQPQQVAGLEMTVQELIRQLVRERESLQRRLNEAGFRKLKDYLATLGETGRVVFDSWFQKLTDHEQASARQSTINADLAMALWKQSGTLLMHFQKKVAPKEQNTYTARGTWLNRPTTAALVRGRL